jgi:cell division septum initiation protein DivIVA
MAWPGGSRDEPAVASGVRLGSHGHLEVAPGAAAAADARLESVCAELGILLARHVEPVSVRVLPFGDEQLAMVQLLDASLDAPQLHAATARGASPSEAVAGAAVRAMTGGHNVLEAALPGAVAEGKVRSAVVFSEGDAPVRWGQAGDEARLAALYAVVPQLGSFTATTGGETYRVLRLPGIGIALVSEGASAAAWVEGWFSALVHATQFALRSTQRSTSVVSTSRATDERPVRDEAPESSASEASASEASASEASASMFERRRLLEAAQREADEIRSAAERDAKRWRKAQRKEVRRKGGTDAEVPRHPMGPERSPRLDDTAVEGERLLREAERVRDRLLADARREVDALRRETERACETLLNETRRECEELRREAERTRTTMIADANRHAADQRRDAEQARRDAEALRAAPQPAGHADARGEPFERRHRADDVVREARRAADDLLHDARRTAEEIVRDATRTRERLADAHASLSRASREGEARHEPSHAWVREEPRGVAATPPVVTDASEHSPPTPGQVAPSAEEARLAAMALLAAAAESIAAMSVILGRTAGAQGAPAQTADKTDPFEDVPGLFFGA